MKKIVCFLLALCLAVPMTVASAASVSGSRNGINTAVSSYRTDNLPAFQVGDEIKFNLTGLISGNEVTVISTKWDASKQNITDPTSFNVQYINQYTLNSTSMTITYKVKETGDGIYALKIKDGNSDIVNFFYKVGSVDLSLIQIDGTAIKDAFGSPYVIRDNGDGKYSVGFIAKATIDDSNVTLVDLKARPGFQIKYDGGKTLSSYFEEAQLASLVQFVSKHEVSGKFSVVYGITVYDIPAADKDKFTAKADMR